MVVHGILDCMLEVTWTATGFDPWVGLKTPGASNILRNWRTRIMV